jgi:hypothetical protein
LHPKRHLYRGTKKKCFQSWPRNTMFRNESQMPFDSTTLTASLASPFASTTQAPQPSTFGSSRASSAALPFGSKSPFGSTSTPYGDSATGTSGFTQAVTSPFGQQQANSAAPFGQSNQSAASPFGQTPTPTASIAIAFGHNPSAGSGTKFDGKTPREILTAFYQQRNPSKITEIDKVIAKYAGKEESLLRNLAKKYNLDPTGTYFGLSAAPLTPSAPATTGFGVATLLGQSAQFGTSLSVGNDGGFGSFASAPSTGFGSGAIFSNWYNRIWVAFICPSSKFRIRFDCGIYRIWIAIYNTLWISQTLMKALGCF